MQNFSFCCTKKLLIQCLKLQCGEKLWMLVDQLPMVKATSATSLHIVWLCDARAYHPISKPTMAWCCSRIMLLETKLTRGITLTKQNPMVGAVFFVLLPLLCPALPESSLFIRKYHVTLKKRGMKDYSLIK